MCHDPGQVGWADPDPKKEVFVGDLGGRLKFGWSFFRGSSSGAGAGCGVLESWTHCGGHDDGLRYGLPDCRSAGQWMGG
jgi:hypothetical protein